MKRQKQNAKRRAEQAVARAERSIILAGWKFSQQGTRFVAKKAVTEREDDSVTSLFESDYTIEGLAAYVERRERGGPEMIQKSTHKVWVAVEQRLDGLNSRRPDQWPAAYITVTVEQGDDKPNIKFNCDAHVAKALAKGLNAAAKRSLS